MSSINPVRNPEQHADENDRGQPEFPAKGMQPQGLMMSHALLHPQAALLRSVLEPLFVTCPQSS